MKHIIVTGAYGEIGKALTSGLAKNADNKILMLGRDIERLNEARDEIIKQYPSASIDTYTLDLGRKEEIYKLAGQWQYPLDILINNAACAPRKRSETPEGIERQWAVNVLGYYHMINAFTPALSIADSARIVNVASYYAGELDIHDPEFKIRTYDNDIAYRQSKQANRMMTAAMAPLLAVNNIIINVCHPGEVNSKISNDLGFGGHESPEKGAATPLYLATSPEINGVTGKYYVYGERKTCKFSDDPIALQKLMYLLKTY